MLNKEEYEYQKYIINTYGGVLDYDCKNCDKCSDEQIEECYYNSNDYCNDTFAKSIDYGGYDSAEEFWDNLLG